MNEVSPADEGVRLHPLGTVSRAKHPRPPTYALYSPGQIVAALVTGTPIAGALLMSLNYRRLGLARLAFTSLAIGVGAMVVDIVYLMRSHVVPGFSVLVFAGSIHRAMRDGSLFDTHTERRGERASSWSVLVIVVAALSTWLMVSILAALAR
jgi:hypothetical protein